MTQQTAATEIGKPLPVWAKVLVGLFVFGVVSILGTIGLLGYVSGQVGNPSYIKSVTNSMVKIDALPPGFRYDKGIELPGAQLVMVVNEKDGTSYSLTTLPNPRELDAKGFADQLKTSRAVGGELAVKESGKIVVGGKDFYYSVGAAPMTPGTELQQMRGALILDNKRAFMIVGTTPEGPYNMEATKQLLASIKGF